MKDNLKKEVLNFNFPSSEILNQVRIELSNPEHLDRNLVLVGSFSNLDKIKFAICQAIINYKLDNKLDNQQLAQALGLQEKLLNKLLQLEVSFSR